MTISGSSVKFEFSGKSGKQQDVVLRDRRLARVVQQCKDIPGYELFQYLDEDGKRQTVGSGDVNDYLRAITGEDFTAKDFRTWGGTVRAVQVLLTFDLPEDDKAAQRQVVEAVKQVARELGNTPTVCRAYYIHPPCWSVTDQAAEGRAPVPAGRLALRLDAIEAPRSPSCGPAPFHLPDAPRLRRRAV